MTTEDQNINDLTPGDTVHIEFTVNDGSGNAVDLTGASAKWVLAENQGEPAVISKNTTGDIEILDPAAGRLRVALHSEDTELLNEDMLYFHELEITDANGNVSTSARGNIMTEVDTA